MKSEIQKTEKDFRNSKKEIRNSFSEIEKPKTKSQPDLVSLRVVRRAKAEMDQAITDAVNKFTRISDGMCVHHVDIHYRKRSGQSEDSAEVITRTQSL